MAKKISRAKRRNRPTARPAKAGPVALAAERGKSPAITLCLITKDEEQFIEGCLQSVKGLCRQMVVVDTGSTDRTPEIAAAAGAEVHHFPWNGSFADARNESLKHATGDWILILDADGELDPAAQDVIRDLVREHSYPTTFSGRSINYQGDGSEVTESMFRMLFPNHQGIRYVGGVHEQVAAADAGVDLENLVADIHMHHYGHLSEVIKEKHKVERNATLTVQALKDKPDDFLTRFHAGAHFVDEANWERAQEEYLWCLMRLRDDTAPVSPKNIWFALVLSSLASVYAKSARYQDGIGCAREALEYDPADVQARYWLGYSLAHADNREEAATVLRELIYDDSAPATSPLFTNKAMQTWMARRELGENEINRGNYAEAWSELELAVQESPRAQGCWILLSIAACALGNFEVGLEMFGVACTIADPPESILQAYRALRNEAPRPEAVELMVREAMAAWPENVVLKHMLADLLDARSVVAEAGLEGSADADLAPRIERLATIWPHWDELRALSATVPA